MWRPRCSHQRTWTIESGVPSDRCWYQEETKKVRQPEEERWWNADGAWFLGELGRSGRTKSIQTWEPQGWAEWEYQVIKEWNRGTRDWKKTKWRRCLVVGLVISVSFPREYLRSIGTENPLQQPSRRGTPRRCLFLACQQEFRRLQILLVEKEWTNQVEQRTERALNTHLKYCWRKFWSQRNTKWKERPHRPYQRESRGDPWVELAVQSHLW